MMPAGAAPAVDRLSRIRSHPLVPDGLPIYGYVYDVRTGKVVEVEAATLAGAVGS